MPKPAEYPLYSQTVCLYIGVFLSYNGYIFAKNGNGRGEFGMNKLSLRQTEELYRPIRLLKESRRGSVSLVRHKETGEEFFLRRFRGDGSAYHRMQAIASPHLPVIHHVCEEDGEVLVIEEYVRGQSLGELLCRRTLSPRETRRIALQLCSALSLLHQQDIVHRDIKPDNVILRDGSAVLVDFDAARLFEPGSAADTQVLGTVGFAAPEQFGISQSDTRADIYALGVMLNIMRTGSHPSMGQLAPGELGRIVRRCTMANPGDRYQSVGHLKRALQAQPRKPWLIGVVSAAAVAALAFAAVRLSLPAPDPPPAAQSAAPTDTPAPTATATPEATPRPLLIPLDVSHTTVSRQFSDEAAQAEITLVEVQPTVGNQIRVTVHLSANRPFTFNAWTASGSWTLSPIPLTAGEQSLVIHVPEYTLTADEQILLSLLEEDAPEENRLVARLSGADIIARLQPSPSPAPSYTPAPTEEKELLTFIDPDRKVLYTNRNLPFNTFGSMSIDEGYRAEFIHAQVQPLEGDMARITVFFSVEKDTELYIHTGSGRWELPTARATPENNGVSFDISRETLKSDTLIQITLAAPFEDIESFRQERHMTVMPSAILDLMTVPGQSIPRPSATPTPAPTPRPSYTVPQNKSAAWDPDLEAAGPVVELPISTEYGANGFEAYGIEIHGVDAQLMEGEVVRFTVRLLAELEFKFYASITIGSGHLWSSGDRYGYEALKVYPGDTRLLIDIPLSELAGRTTLWMQFTTRSPSLDGSDADIINQARVHLGIQTILETLSAAGPLPEEAHAQRTPLSAPIDLPCSTNYTGSDGIPSSGFRFYGLTAQLFSDNTVTFILSFAAEGTFIVSLFEPPSGTRFGQITANSETPGWTLTLPFSQVATLSGLTAKFYQNGNYANTGFLYVSGDDLHSILP